VSCRFERCHFSGHFSSADYIDYTFTGKIDGCVWYGTVPAGHVDVDRHNVITGNDFAGAVFSANVGWRGDIDFAAQQWPDGLEAGALASAAAPLAAPP